MKKMSPRITRQKKTPQARSPGLVMHHLHQNLTLAFAYRNRPLNPNGAFRGNVRVLLKLVPGTCWSGRLLNRFSAPRANVIFRWRYATSRSVTQSEEKTWAAGSVAGVSSMAQKSP